MKGKLKFLLLASLLSFVSLTGCSGGGSYGDGRWVKVDVEEDEGVYTYTLNLDSSARGCIIVRVNSNNEIDWDNAGNEVFDNKDVVWNKTGDIMLLREGGNITWIFRD